MDARTPDPALQTPPRVDASADQGRVPRTPIDVMRAAGLLGIMVPDACMPGVLANLALLDAHAGALLAQLPDRAL